jgi:DNA-nicking Smr family endonuclease
VARYVRDEVEATAFCLFAMAEGLVHRHVFQGHGSLGREQVIERGVTMLAAYFEQQVAAAAA